MAEPSIPTVANLLFDEATFHVNAAKRIESTDGNPMEAAEHYTRAATLLLHALRECFINLPEADQKAAVEACQGQLRIKIQHYLARAAMLFKVARDEQLSMQSKPHAAPESPAPHPPPPENFVEHADPVKEYHSAAAAPPAPVPGPQAAQPYLATDNSIVPLGVVVGEPSQEVYYSLGAAPTDPPNVAPHDFRFDNPYYDGPHDEAQSFNNLLSHFGAK